MNPSNQTFVSTAWRRAASCLFRVILTILSGVSGSVFATEEVAPAPAPSKTSHISEKLWQDRPLASLKATLQRTDGDLPENMAATRMADATWIEQSGDEGRPWVMTSYQWDAPGTCHLPLFFEEPNLERMGYREDALGCFESDDFLRTPGCLQPLWSGVHFLGCFASLPYQCGYMPPCQPISTLGVDRPGSPTCYRRHLTPLSCRGAVYQAGVVTGLVFILP
jgi:hypothetical protein